MNVFYSIHRCLMSRYISGSAHCIIKVWKKIFYYVMLSYKKFTVPPSFNAPWRYNTQSKQEFWRSRSRTRPQFFVASFPAAAVPKLLLRYTLYFYSESRPKIWSKTQQNKPCTRPGIAFKNPKTHSNFDQDAMQTRLKILTFVWRLHIWTKSRQRLGTRQRLGKD
jgi:hypothetical protein